MAARMRKGPKHPGVVLIKPDPARRIGWRARFRDPDKDKLVKVALDPSLTTAEQRASWAVNKSRDLAKRRVELESGAVRATGEKLPDALKRFFKANTRLRAGTLDLYQRVSDKFEAWAQRERVGCDELNRPLLSDFRTVLINEKRRVHSAGTKRKEVRETEDPRAAATVNSDLRKLGTILKHLVDLDLFPKLNGDDVRRALKKLPTTTERAEFLKPEHCRGLLEAAQKHDAATYAATRDEHAGRGKAGSTLRYDPIAPFVAFVLLSGCRFGEAVTLQWRQVDLDAHDADGKPVGEIHLSGADVKTRQHRTIDLSVSPALRTMLAEMKEAGTGKGSVFGLTRPQAEASAKRLRATYGAPVSFTWQSLRRTCGTYLTNAPGIFGAASAYRSARQLGHSVQVAERHYLGVHRVPKEARTLEAAMGIEAQLSRSPGASEVEAAQ